MATAPGPVATPASAAAAAGAAAAAAGRRAARQRTLSKRLLPPLGSSCCWPRAMPCQACILPASHADVSFAQKRASYAATAAERLLETPRTWPCASGCITLLLGAF